MRRHGDCRGVQPAPVPSCQERAPGRLLPVEARFPPAQLVYTRRDTTSGQEAGFLSRRRRGAPEAETPALPLNFLKGDRATRVPLPSGGSTSTGHAREGGTTAKRAPAARIAHIARRQSGAVDDDAAAARHKASPEKRAQTAAAAHIRKAVTESP